MDETEKIRFCGLIGNPVSHSLSPLMQNAAFDLHDLDIHYFTFEVKEDSILSVLDSIRKNGSPGLNVTIPYKSKVMKYLDWIDAPARRIGAVNTIVNENGILKGYNTDGPGAMDSLVLAGMEQNGSVLIVGAGDTARTIGYMLADEGIETRIVNRTHSRAEDLALELNKITSSIAVSHEDLHLIDDISTIVNCTSVGMTGGPAGSPIPSELIREDMLVFDIVYTPMDTPLLIDARRKGARILHGLEMLVNQGARSFELWTGKEAPRELMKEVVIEELRKNIGAL